MKFQRLYDRTPILFQNFMATVYGYLTKNRRYGETYNKHLKYLDKIHKYSRKELEDLQFEELMKLLRNTIEKSKFYRELYNGVDINSFESVDDLRKLPIVTKEMIRQNIDDIITIPKSKSNESSTGGTTGKSLTVYFTTEDTQKRMAILDCFKKSHGFENIKMKRATFSGKHIVPPNQKQNIFWRYNASINQMLYSVFHITDENIPFYIKGLNKYKPNVLDGYISSIYDIANYIDRNNLELQFDLIAIFPTAEPVTVQYRELVERVFKCKVYDQYASSEGAPFVYECKFGNLHYDLTTGIIENLEESNEILVTSFTTYGTPLIRYKIGDSMEFEKNDMTCQCGLHMPIVKNIEGRSINYLYSTNGAKISEVAVAFNANPDGVIKYQIIQNTLTHILVKLVIDNNFKNENKYIFVDEIKHKLGRDMEVDFDLVDDIPREKSGKYRLIVNNVIM